MYTNNAGMLHAYEEYQQQRHEGAVCISGLWHKLAGAGCGAQSE